MNLTKGRTFKDHNLQKNNVIPIIKDEPKLEPKPKPKPKASEFEPVKIKLTKTYDFSTISNAYEFLQAWNSIEPNDHTNYARLLDNIKPSDLPKYIGSKLDDQMLSNIIKGLHVLSSSKDVITYFISLANIQRFSFLKMFISKESHDLIIDVLGRHVDPSEAEKIKQFYSIQA